MLCFSDKHGKTYYTNRSDTVLFWGWTGVIYARLTIITALESLTCPVKNPPKDKWTVCTVHRREEKKKILVQHWTTVTSRMKTSSTQQNSLDNGNFILTRSQDKSTRPWLGGWMGQDGQCWHGAHARLRALPGSAQCLAALSTHCRHFGGTDVYITAKHWHDAQRYVWLYHD